MLSPGNTPLHLAMDSAHAEAACMLIEAGADRERVRRFLPRAGKCFASACAFDTPLTLYFRQPLPVFSFTFFLFACPRRFTPHQMNLDNEAPEDMVGVGDPEQARAKKYVVERCGKRMA